ncbi:EAL domain-containing protein [Chitinolyticbacter albus]|uniref:EAL domain-containing protein n=1 Tax=Chitinolyticbacter albus TaxID=2961951 RepID=UPI00210EBFA2|nr:EAL domain-containing protein [Chitinolyticbacter albus]
MSLLRQLWLLVITATVVAFLGSAVVNLYTARNYLEQQLYAQSTDSAASLALSMTQQPKDAATIELMVSALFDSGHFALVRYSNVDGEVISERANSGEAGQVPQWFIELFPIEVATGQAEVSDGWQQAGRVTVIAHSRFAQQALWDGAFKLLLLIGGAGLLSGLVMHRLFLWVKRPIVQMVGQAEAISERRFVTIPVPRVTELRAVVQAMNTMVERVKTMFAEQAARIDALRSEANRDALTQLPNRNFFMGRLAQALGDEESAPDGALLLLRLHDLIGLNRRLGRERADQFLQSVAGKLGVALSAQPDALLARLNGADFAVLLPGEQAELAEDLAQRMQAGLAELRRAELADQPDLAAIGIAPYRASEAIGTVLARCDEALAQAEGSRNGIQLAQRDATPPVRSGQEWQAEIRRALDKGAFRLAAYPVLRQDGTLWHREMMLRLQQADGQLLTAGTFMPMASRLGLTSVLDLETVRLACAELERSQDDVAVNLSAVSIADAQFVDKLLALLRGHKAQTSRLWLEVNEFGFRDEMMALAEFARRVRPLGCKVGIEHFGRHFGSIPQLYELQLDYLKLDSSFVQGIEMHTGNQQLIKAIVGVAQGNGLMSIAEGVQTDAEWDMLAKLGVQGMTGPVTSRREPR